MGDMACGQLWKIQSSRLPLVPKTNLEEPKELSIGGRRKNLNMYSSPSHFRFPSLKRGGRQEGDLNPMQFEVLNIIHIGLDVFKLENRESLPPEDVQTSYKKCMKFHPGYGLTVKKYACFETAPYLHSTCL